MVPLTSDRLGPSDHHLLTWLSISMSIDLLCLFCKHFYSYSAYEIPDLAACQNPKPVTRLSWQMHFYLLSFLLGVSPFILITPMRYWSFGLTIIEIAWICRTYLLGNTLRIVKRIVKQKVYERVAPNHLHCLTHAQCVLCTFQNI